MNIAKVIVDVPSSFVNQTFDYNIPEKFHQLIKPGMRVIIPFGPRKITGFVIELIDRSSFGSLKDIIDVLDITPILTAELLQLGKWLADETISLYNTTYYAMLPQLLKAKYDKEVIKSETANLDKHLEKIFSDRNKVLYSELIIGYPNYQKLQKYVEAGELTINYVIKSQITKRYETYVVPCEIALLENSRQQITKRAKRQLAIIDYFIEHNEPVHQNKLYQILDINRANLKPLIDKGLISLDKREVYRNPYEKDFPKTKHLSLTEEQTIAITPILQKIEEQKHETFLLHGITGSGKTEVYLQAIAEVLKKGKEAIVLVPEISLTPQMVKRFKGRFGDQVAVLHSALSIGEKYDEWRKILRKEVKVVVGARSAIFAPFENLGIIIIDEEHETTYKQEESPRYHAKDVAIKRGELNKCPVVLGSATPTLEAYARAQKGVYQLLTMERRTNAMALPEVNVVDMRAELQAGNRTMFSRTLIDHIKQRLLKKEQIVLLLNRRGYSNFALCRDCGHVEQCPNCDISLTYHKHYHRLKCHYCNYESPMLVSCPACQSDALHFFGTGTERVEESLTSLIPEARIIRMDVDTTRKKGSHERLLNRFANQEADVLLGTQMIAKGLDFENVTLVGVLAADSMLHLPDFRAAEKSFQLITQVSGRAGRHELKGEVIVQTYSPDHYSIQLASEYNYKQFYLEEMSLRRTFKYPPYVYLALITVTHENEMKVYEVANKISQQLRVKLTGETTLLGPAPSPIPRINNRYRYQIMLKYRFEKNIISAISEVLENLRDERKEDVQMIVDINPFQLM